MTDSVFISIIKQNADTFKGADSSKNSSSNTAIDENTSYVEELSLQEHASAVGTCAVIDPGRRDLLYCMSEDGQKVNKKLRQKHKPDGVKNAEAKAEVGPVLYK
ncbi:hypothetical protein BD770DRAFT_438757 [Pilaira anomala]|nr:hypothetical protein BD770DRAFT_438757 [Pilaira anomala]